jgi:5-deoxy-glucuronate isomerase
MPTTEELNEFLKTHKEEKVGEPPAKVQRREEVAAPQKANLVQSPVNLKVSPAAPNADGRITHVSPESAGWGHVGFDVFRLAPGQKLAQETGSEEHCVVLVTGTGDVSACGQTYSGIGGRSHPHEDKAPGAVYVPKGGSWQVTAATDVELAVCKAPGGGNHPVRLIEGGSMSREVRGKGNNTRHIRNILPDSDPAAHSLLVVEVVTPSGNWSSYPPHRHDTDDLPNQSYLEETYYHRLNPPQGFGFQRVYTDDRTLDETMAVHDGDVVMVPRGYHPCGVPHGYELYYLNVMAGPTKRWKFHNDPKHEWIMGKL